MHALIRLALLTLTLALVVTPKAVLGQLLDNPISTPIVSGDTTVSLIEVASGGLLMTPIWAGSAPGVTDKLYVADEVGKIITIPLPSGSSEPPTFVDVKAQTGFQDAEGRFQLLSVAFHPSYAANGFFYTYTLEPPIDPSTSLRQAAHFSTLTEPTNDIHQTVLREWKVTDPTTPEAVVGGVSEILFRIDQPQLNSNGGAMGFDADGLLYIGIGDGGGIDDTDNQTFEDEPMVGHGMMGNGQNPGTILGSILRIDPLGDDPGSYVIPVDNPFVSDGVPIGGQAGCDVGGGCDETYAIGFHNPVQLSFERRGLLYVSDAGQRTETNQNIEEVDIVIAGGDYGWNSRAGTFQFDTSDLENPGFLVEVSSTEDFIDPIAEYDHDEGTSIVGGFTYNGSLVPSLIDRYIFGDMGAPAPEPAPESASEMDQMCNGRLFFLEFIQFDRETLEFLVESSLLELSEIFELQTADLAGRCVLGFGQDANGEMYVLANRRGRASPNMEEPPSGMVLKIN